MRCEGETLAHEMETRRRSLRAILGDLASLLDVLADMHTRSPAVVHGGIKPETVVRRADGAIVLIDAHAARNDASIAEPPTIATDIQAAASLAVALFTREPQHGVVEDAHRLRWAQSADVPSDVKRFLARMLDPSVKRRPRDAAALAREARALSLGTPTTRRFAYATLSFGVAAIASAIGYRALPPTRPAVSATLAAALLARMSAVAPLAPPSPLPPPRCEANGSCSRLDEGDVATQIRNACGRLGATTSDRAATVKLRFADREATCSAHLLPGERCFASCASRPIHRRSRPDTDAIERALRDEYGSAFVARPDAHDPDVEQRRARTCSTAGSSASTSRRRASR